MRMVNVGAWTRSVPAGLEKPGVRDMTYGPWFAGELIVYEVDVRGGELAIGFALF
ncbi:MAG: hypothetical protein ACLFS8_03935 [Clostridia bacterium]